MKLIFGLFCCLGASLVVKTVEAVHYDTNYIQAPCDNSRNFTLGANGYQRYGIIKADDDGCYNTYINCKIQLSATSGYYITLRFHWIAIAKSDFLIITDTVQTHRIEGYITPPYSINSTSNWMDLEFSTYADINYCLGGFNLYYTSFHYGECSENEFRCSLDGRCIPNEVVCDSYDNCGDSSDEMNGTCTVTDVTPPESVNPVYDHSYIQAPCDFSGNRELTPGANGYQRYGFIEADNDRCYNPHSDCHIRLSVSSGYQIITRFQWIAIEYWDTLIITEATGKRLITGHVTPPNSIYSASNWMDLEFFTSTHSICLAGFRLYYTSFHYGECSENEFRCSYDGRCIPNEVVCDSYDNCGDWSDEMNGTCSGSGSGLTTGAIVAISVTCALVGIALSAFLAHCINRRKQQRRSSSSSSSVECRRSNPARNVATSEPLGFVEPIGPPKYIDAPPAYTNTNSIYEDPDQIHPPPYQSTFTTTPYGSNNNSESLACNNDNTPRLNNHEDNSNNSNSHRADRGNSNDAYHF